MCHIPSLFILQGYPFSRVGRLLFFHPAWLCFPCRSGAARPGHRIPVRSMSPHLNSLKFGRVACRWWVSQQPGWIRRLKKLEMIKLPFLFDFLHSFRDRSWLDLCFKCWWDSPVLLASSCVSSVLWPSHQPFRWSAYRCSTPPARTQDTTGASLLCV